MLRFSLSTNNLTTFLIHSMLVLVINEGSIRGIYILNVDLGDGYVLFIYLVGKSGYIKMD